MTMNIAQLLHFHIQLKLYLDTSWNMHYENKRSKKIQMHVDVADCIYIKLTTYIFSRRKSLFFTTNYNVQRFLTKNLRHLLETYSWCCLYRSFFIY